MIFKVESGSYSYTMQKLLLQDINIEVKKGEVLTILGPNGIGKTTLLKCMMGILKWQKGQSLIDDRPLSGLSTKEVWKRMAYVPQAKSSVMPYTALEMIVLGRSAHIELLKQPGKKDLEIAEKVMAELGIEALKDKSCTQMSGGELQMVLMARALASQPELLILDEPESNLDFKNQLIILKTIQQLSKELGISCIVNTHYPEHALRIGDKALLLSRNGEKFYGGTKKIITQENITKVFEVEAALQHLKVKGREYTCIFPIDLIH